MKIVLRKNFRTWLFWGINGLLLLLAVLCVLISLGVTSTLPTLSAAKTWAGQSGERFAQIACYLPQEAPATEENIFTFRRTLEEKLRTSSMEAPEGGSLFTDAYSGVASLTVSSERAKVTAKALGVGGDFFRFHPLTLRSGSYLSESDLMKDRVLLDESLAWKLFGGTDLAGLSVTIDGKSFYIAGVVGRETDRYSTEAGSQTEGFYLPYSTLKELNEAVGVTEYEVVLPDPIRSFGKNLVQESFPLGDGILVENSARYSLSNLFSVVKNFGKRSMGMNGIIYPYWENAVRLTEDYAALLLVLTLLFAVCPAVSVTVFLIRLLIQLVKKAEAKTKEKISSSVEAHREKKWQQAAGKKD